MIPAQEKFELLMREIDKFLAIEGFHRSGKHFLKRMPDKNVRWNIWPQRSKWTTAAQTKFTFEVWAEWKHRWARYEEWKPKAAWYGAVGDRIGCLTPKKEDTWWELTEGTSIDLLGDQINGVMSSSVLPFLRQFQTEQDIKKFLRACPVDNYITALVILELDLMDGKPGPEIEESISRARRLGRTSGQSIEAGVKTVIKALGSFMGKKSRSEMEESINEARPAAGGGNGVVEAAIQRILKAYGDQKKEHA
jgi:Domain of unknown function (DUF4304)